MDDDGWVKRFVGVIIKLKSNESKEVYFMLNLFLGDNLRLNTVLGFTKKVRIILVVSVIATNLKFNQK